MKFFKKQLPLILGMLLIAGSMTAQVQQQQMQQVDPDSVSDEEIKQLVNVAKVMQANQEETQERLVAILEGEDMDLDRLQQIMMSRQNPQLASQIDSVTQAEEQIIQEIQPRILQLTQELQQKYIQAVRDTGIEPARFQQLMQGVQTQPELNQRYQEAMADTAETGGMN